MFTAMHVAQMNSMAAIRNGGSGRLDMKEFVDDMNRDTFIFGAIVCSMFAFAVLVPLGFWIFHEPPQTVEATAVVSNVSIEYASGSGNGKAKDALWVQFDNGLYFRHRFNRRDGVPADYQKFKVGQKYKLWHFEGRKEIRGYELVE
jgi:hypothetical protein